MMIVPLNQEMTLSDRTAKAAQAHKPHIAAAPAERAARRSRQRWRASSVVICDGLSISIA